MVPETPGTAPSGEKGPLTEGERDADVTSLAVGGVHDPIKLQAIAQVAALRLLHDERTGSDGSRRWGYCAECRQEWPCKTMALIEAMRPGEPAPGPYFVYDLPNGARFVRHGYPKAGEWYSDGGTFERSSEDWEHDGHTVDIYSHERGDREHSQPDHSPRSRPRGCLVIAAPEVADNGRTT